MDGWLLCAMLFIYPEISPASNSVQTLQKSFGWHYEPRYPCVCIYTHAKRSRKHVKDPVVHVRVWWIHYGIIKITQHALKSVRAFRVLKLDTTRKKKKYPSVVSPFFLFLCLTSRQCQHSGLMDRWPRPILSRHLVTATPLFCSPLSLSLPPADRQQHDVLCCTPTAGETCVKHFPLPLPARVWTWRWRRARQTWGCGWGLSHATSLCSRQVRSPASHQPLSRPGSTFMGVQTPRFCHWLWWVCVLL